VLGTVDADDDGRIHATLTIPDDVPPGSASIEGGHAMPVGVVVTGP
jgi:hypothetical protein